MTRPVSQPGSVGTLLGVWAHPDDEAYLSAGLMARSVAAGHRVVVATATAGELGAAPGSPLSPERLAGLRALELAASLAALGVQEHRWGGMADGGCAALPLALGVAWVRRLIDEVEPDTIVTFGPDGLTGHTDHQAVSAWTTAAWEATGRRARLWYATLTPAFHEQWGTLSAEVGIWMDEQIRPSTPVSELALHLVCDGALLDSKLDALRAQRSQTQPLIDAVGEQAYRRWWTTEAFVDAERALHVLSTRSPSLEPAGQAA